jgi:hypothetical protein
MLRGGDALLSSMLCSWSRMALVAILVAIFPWSIVLGQDVTLHGKTFYKDSEPWVPKGLKVEGFSRPKFIPAAPKWMNDASAQGRDWWGRAELDAIRTVFGGDTIRFAISQPALDPQSPIYDPQYPAELLAVFKQARAAGFVVIPSMDAQAENGLPDLPCMPGDSAVRAWQTIAPALIHDRGIMFELFDEPCKSSNAQTRQEWAQSMQALISAVRRLGATNVLLVDGLWWARSTNGLFPLIHDTAPDRLALAVHPYLVKDAFVTQKQWHDQFGASAAQYPLIASEWNATPTNGCVDGSTPALALSLMRYLQSLGVGLIGWAIDSNAGKLVKDHSRFEPTDYASFKNCHDNSVSGGGKLLAVYPHN